MEDLDEENVGGEGSLEVMEGVIEEDYVDDDDDYCKHLFIHYSFNLFHFANAYF